MRVEVLGRFNGTTISCGECRVAMLTQGADIINRVTTDAGVTLDMCERHTQLLACVLGQRPRPAARLPDGVLIDSVSGRFVNDRGVAIVAPDVLAELVDALQLALREAIELARFSSNTDSQYRALDRLSDAFVGGR